MTCNDTLKWALCQAVIYFFLKTARVSTTRTARISQIWLDLLETCEADTITAIINEVNPKINKERLIVCFVFAVYAK